MPPEQSTLSLLVASIMWSPLHVLIPLILVQRIVELRHASRNARRLRERGALEIGADHYGAIVALHTLWFIGMIVEIVVLSRAVNPFWPALLAIFLAAQGLRYWAIRSLGEYWNTRILVVPGMRLVRAGPYRYLKHPNYVAVAIELFVAPVLLGAYLTAVSVSLLNAAMLAVRIRAESRALDEYARRPKRGR